MEGHEPVSRNVGSKLLFLALMLLVFGVIALVLMPLGSMFGPPPPPPAAGAEPGPGMIGAFMPGIILVIVSLVVAVLAGLMLGYDKARHQTTE